MPLFLEEKSYLHLCVKIFILRTRDTKARTWTQSWGCRYRGSICVSHLCFYYVGPSLRGFCTCCPLLPADPQHCCWLIFFRNHPLTPLSSIQQIMSRLFHSTACTRCPKHPFPFSPLLVPNTGSNALTLE